MLQFLSTAMAARRWTTLSPLTFPDVWSCSERYSTLWLALWCNPKGWIFVRGNIFLVFNWRKYPRSVMRDHILYEYFLLCKISFRWSSPNNMVWLCVFKSWSEKKISIFRQLKHTRGTRLNSRLPSLQVRRSWYLWLRGTRRIQTWCSRKETNSPLRPDSQTNQAFSPYSFLYCLFRLRANIVW